MSRRPGALSSILANRARQTCPRQKAWGATCAQRLDGSRILQFTPSIDFATLFIDASRDIRCRVALDFTLQHYFQQTPPPVGESRLFSCMFLDTFRAGFGEIRKLCARSDRDLRYDNDPSAGSPTETLLRLLLPLNDKV
ncbi:hypothetical protein Bca4012_103628 [Brassica carinata]